jgi:RNA polymerase-binding transcription factor DksA
MREFEALLVATRSAVQAARKQSLGPFRDLLSAASWTISAAQWAESGNREVALQRIADAREELRRAEEALRAIG